MALYYMLASMSNVLKSKHENKTTAYNTNYSLRKMFANKSRPTRYEALKAFMNARMAEGE
jgi:hypothetical protein